MSSEPLENFRHISPVEHYAMAEQHLLWARQTGADDPVGEAIQLRYAQVHATLATANESFIGRD